MSEEELYPTGTGSVFGDIGNLVDNVTAPIGTAIKDVTAPVGDFLKGGPLGNFLKGGPLGDAIAFVGKNPGLIAQVAIGLVESVISLVPGIGPEISSAIALGISLAEGNNITQALLDATMAALPGGPLVELATKTAYTAASDIAKGKPIADIGLDVVRANLPGAPESQAAFDTVFALAHGKTLQDAGFAFAKGMLPGNDLAQKALSFSEKALNAAENHEPVLALVERELMTDVQDLGKTLGTQAVNAGISKLGPIAAQVANPLVAGLASLPSSVVAAQYSIPEPLARVLLGSLVPGTSRIDPARLLDLTRKAQMALTPAAMAAKDVDTWLLQPDFGGHMVVQITNGLPRNVAQGGHYPSSGEVLMAAQVHSADYGGEMGKLANLPYIWNRLHQLALSKQRPDEAQPIGTIKGALPILHAYSTNDQIDDYLVNLVQTMPIKNIALFAHSDPNAPWPATGASLPANATQVAARLDAKSNLMTAQASALQAQASAYPPGSPNFVNFMNQFGMAMPKIAAVKAAVAKFTAESKSEALLDALQGPLAPAPAAALSPAAQAMKDGLARYAASQAAASYDRLAERTKWTNYFLGFAQTMHAAGAWGYS